jgi:hypothetical protein
MVMVNFRKFGMLGVTAGLCISAIGQYDSLYEVTGTTNKAAILPETLPNHRVSNEYAYYFNKAITHYPELHNVHIKIQPSRIKTSANARPTLGSLFRKRKNRRYVIRLNTSEKPGKVLFTHLDTNARIGLLGHEIGHLFDYHHGKCGIVLGRGFAYLNKKTKAKFEREIDYLTIQRGLGNQLYSFAYFVLFQSDAPEKYKQFKRTTYLTPEEIKELLK